MSPPRIIPSDAEQTVRDALSRVSSAGDDLEDVLAQTEAAVRDVFLRRHNELGPALETLREAKAALEAAVAAHPLLFAKRRSRVAAGVQVQVRKRPDKWELDADATADLIREHLPHLASAVSTKTVVDTKKLESLSTAQLKKIGVVRTKVGENTHIKRLRDDLDERLAQVGPWLS